MTIIDFQGGATRPPMTGQTAEVIEFRLPEDDPRPYSKGLWVEQNRPPEYEAFGLILHKYQTSLQKEIAWGRGWQSQQRVEAWMDFVVLVYRTFRYYTLRYPRMSHRERKQLTAARLTNCYRTITEGHVTEALNDSEYAVLREIAEKRQSKKRKAG